MWDITIHDGITLFPMWTRGPGHAESELTNRLVTRQIGCALSARVGQGSFARDAMCSGHCWLRHGLQTGRTGLLGESGKGSAPPPSVGSPGALPPSLPPPSPPSPLPWRVWLMALVVSVCLSGALSPIVHAKSGTRRRSPIISCAGARQSASREEEEEDGLITGRGVELH